MDLLYLLASRPGQPVPRDLIMTTLWPGLVMGEDSLARTVSKLRQALGDDARSPRYIETLSKRGYRLLAEVEHMTPAVATLEPTSRNALPRQSRRLWLLASSLLACVMLVIGSLALSGRLSPDVSLPTNSTKDSGLLLARADDYYFQFSRGDNEAAIELYERVLGLHPDDAGALAGLANALVQRSLRWPQATPGQGVIEFTRLGDALANGHLDREPARSQLQRARQLAERAVAVAPDSAAAHKALGFVASAQRQFDPALASYARAVQLDPDSWGPMINHGDLLEIMGRGVEALPHFEQAYAAMGRAYVRNPVQVRPWYAPMGVLIAERYRARGDLLAAESWYRRVLAHSPLQPDATKGLAAVLRKGGDAAAAERLCAELVQRLGTEQGCELETSE